MAKNKPKQVVLGVTGEVVTSEDEAIQALRGIREHEKRIREEYDEEIRQIEKDKYMISTEILGEVKEVKKKQYFGKTPSFKTAFIEEYGNFFFKSNGNNVKVFQDEISESDLVRLIYTASYMNYDNKLMTDTKKAITKAMLKSFIGTRDCIFYPWYNTMVSKEIILEKDDGLFMNEKFYKKGSIVGGGYNRLFIRAIRQIYDENRGVNIKTLGVIFKMLLHVNHEFNYVCWNVDESDEDKLELISVQDLIEVLGYKKSTYKTHVEKFKNAISKYRVYDGQPIVIFFSDDSKNDYMLVNPRLIYDGDMDNLPVIYKLFLVLGNEYNKKQKSKKKINKKQNATLK